MNKTSDTNTVFERWPKTPRLFGGCTITEKIDGTNGAVVILRAEDGPIESPEPLAVLGTAGERFEVFAQSRKRLLQPTKGQDNFGFAAWVQRNAPELFETLGVGRHFGEWYGQGIQRGYGMDHRRFALFNTKRWAEERLDEVGIGLEAVPVLYQGEFGTRTVDNVLNSLNTLGSFAQRGYDKPEGLVVYHSASDQLYKVLYGDAADTPKSAVSAVAAWSDARASSIWPIAA